MGRFKSKKRVESTPSTLSPPPQVIEWAVKSSCRPSSSQDIQAPQRSIEVQNGSTERMLPSGLEVVSHKASSQQTPLSHHLHHANMLLELTNESDDGKWNAKESCDSSDDL